MKKKRIPMIIIGILVIFALIWWAGIDETIMLVMSADINYLLLALAMQILATLAWALRWGVFLKTAGIQVGFKQILMATLIGVFFNNITPGARAGGEPARMVVISKESKSGYGQVFATIMADRILDVIPVMVFTFIAFKYALSLRIHILLLVLSISTVSLMVILTVSILLSFNEKLAMKFLKWIIGILKRIFPKKFEDIEEKLEERLKKSIFEFKETLVELSKDKAVLIKTMFYSFALWIFMILRTYFVFESIGYPLELYKILMVQMAGIALGMISILPGGVGITEAVNSALYLSLSINKSLAVTATVIDRFISFWLPSIVGGALSIYLGVKSGGIKEKS
ncbi:flippase-like domain-containing protein [Thermococcus sp. M39]|uniref:flippase-like domain-containing protein n=1 Tax=unclassified Thermococcus TaxID=2627626 RepID=UPI00143B89DC|nr:MULTISPECIES: flippase-like domain-containing protein [unclassified Thermococcus]NJE08336.1 flippase-like domain-containing protein [Thermococcus sp. M39]NJE11827.1 flippase-like domain-containing protein [Thermococcus sp. LS2]